MTEAVSDPVTAQRLATAFRADPNRTFSSKEAEILAAAAERNLWAAKAAGLHYFRNAKYERALALMRGILDREPSAENIKNIAVVLRSLGRHQEAIEWTEARKEAFDPIGYHDMLSGLFRALGKTSEATAHGERSLRLKDESVAPGALPEPVVRPFDPARRSRNVISFSIWGENVRYLNGAITNAIVARYLYPGWTPRFYADLSTPQGFRDALVQHGAEVVLVEDLPAHRFGIFWRFLVEDDPEVDIYLIRDADSVLNIKERWAVADWLNSRKAFHVMRDNPQHSELMLAGMWGAHRGNINGMRERFEDYVASRSNVADTTLDQLFLRNIVWPIVRNSVKVHDDYFDFMDPTRFSPDFALPWPMHIGQDDWVNFRMK